MMRRAMRTGFLGVTLGLLVSLVVVSRAQVREPVPVPLVTALQSVALAADLNLVVAGVPAVDVYLPQLTADWRGVLFGLALSHGLMVCEISADTVIVSNSSGAAELCVKGDADEVELVEVPEPLADAAPLAAVAVAAPEVVEEPLDGGLVYRVRLLQLDETRAVDLGIDWSGGVFDTAARLVIAGYEMSQGYMPSSGLAEVVRFLESEGVGIRLEDVELRARTGQRVTFNRGGSISVNLVGDGGGSIVERYQYGLGVELLGSVVEAGVVDLAYVFRDSAPSNVADPSNVQMASTDAASSVRVECGESVVLAAIGTMREGLQGQGLPVLASVPVIGYAAGVGGYVGGRVSFVVTVDVGCVA